MDITIDEVNKDIKVGRSDSGICRDDVEMLLEVARQVSRRDRAITLFGDVLATTDIPIPQEREPLHLVAGIAAYLTQKVIKRCGWQIDKLESDQLFMSMIILLVGCDYFSRTTKSRFEECMLYAPIMAFGGRNGLAATKLVPQVGQEFNRLATDPEGSHFLKGIGDAFAGWLSHRDDAELDPIAGIAKIMVPSVR